MDVKKNKQLGLSSSATVPASNSQTVSATSGKPSTASYGHIKKIAYTYRDTVRSKILQMWKDWHCIMLKAICFCYNSIFRTEPIPFKENKLIPLNCLAAGASPGYVVLGHYILCSSCLAVLGPPFLFLLFKHLLRWSPGNMPIITARNCIVVFTQSER